METINEDTNVNIVNHYTVTRKLRTLFSGHHSSSLSMHLPVGLASLERFFCTRDIEFHCIQVRERRIRYYYYGQSRAHTDFDSYAKETNWANGTNDHMVAVVVVGFWSLPYFCSYQKAQKLCTLSVLKTEGQKKGI